MRSNSLLMLIVVLAGGAGVAAPALGQATGVVQLLADGKYVQVAKWYEEKYRSGAEVDDLFNAAFYARRADDDVAAMRLGKEYLGKTQCKAAKSPSPRLTRHCALAAELAGDLDAAEVLFGRYAAVARLWEHRSRADGGLERIALRKSLASARAEIVGLTREAALLKARCPAPAVPGSATPPK